jgi:hypothetical protein
VDGFAFVASLVSSLAWPVLILVLAVVFRHQIAELIGRLRTVKALGAEGTFDPKEAEASVALATAKATATVQATTSIKATTATIEGQATAPLEVVPFPSNRQLTERLMSVANSDPQAAVLEAYAEVERAMKRRMTDAKVAGVERLQGSELLDVALRKAVINRETAEAARGILVLRNLADHDKDIGLEKALDYLSLADAVMYSIEVTRVFAGVATGTGTAYDATVKVTETKR